MLRGGTLVGLTVVSHQETGASASGKAHRSRIVGPAYRPHDRLSTGEIMSPTTGFRPRILNSEIRPALYMSAPLAVH